MRQADPVTDPGSDLVLVGGGAFAREIYHWFVPGLAASGRRFVGYLDDGEEPFRRFGRALPQLGGIAGHRPDPAYRLVMAIGSPDGKRAVAHGLLGAGGVFASLVHPRAWVSASARIGRGVVAGVFADISADAVLEDFVTLNGFASAGHDVRIGSFSTLSGYVDLTGGVQVGEECFFGSGARVLPGVAVGARSKIGAGAVVVRSCAENSTLYAAPARTL